MPEFGHQAIITGPKHSQRSVNLRVFNMALIYHQKKIKHGASVVGSNTGKYAG